MQLQLKFDEIQELKKERKDLKAQYKDALAQTDHYEEICEQIKELREKKKQIEARVQEDMGKDYERIEMLNREIKMETEALSELALNDYTKGEHVEVKDVYENKYVPEFVVKFKKDNHGQTTE